MLHRKVAVFTLFLAGVFGLAACASSTAAPVPASEAASSEAPSRASAEDQDSDSQSDGGAAAGEASIPSGARAASAEFPFPVPEEWQELEPFVEGTIGKDTAMSAIYAHPGDAETAAGVYEQILKAAGFDAYANPVGALTNDASLMAEGLVNGVAYKGSLDFDTNAEGVARVRINLIEN